METYAAARVRSPSDVTSGKIGLVGSMCVKPLLSSESLTPNCSSGTTQVTAVRLAGLKL